MRSTYEQGGGLFENNSAHRAYIQVLAYALTPYSAAPWAMLITFGHALLQSIRRAGHEFKSCYAFHTSHRTIRGKLRTRVGGSKGGIIETVPGWS